MATLPIDLQEAVWDVLERIVIGADASGGRLRWEAATHQVMHRTTAGEVLAADVAVALDHGTRFVYVMAVGRIG